MRSAALQWLSLVSVSASRSGAQARLAAWTFVDQALSSLTNALLMIVVGRTVSVPDFGAFATVFLVFAFTLGLSRAAVTDPLLIRFSAAEEEVRRAAVGRATGTGLLFGIGVGLTCIFAALVAGRGGPFGGALLAMGIVLPGVVLQDIWRYAFFAAARPIHAAANDLVWALLQFGSIGVLLASGHQEVVLIVLSWGLAAAVAAAIGIAQAGVWPQVQQGFGWLRENWSLSVRLGGDYAVNQGAYNAATMAIGPIASLGAVGALAAARTLLGPLNLLYSGITSYALPTMVRVADDRRRLVRPVLWATAGTVSITAVWLVFLLTMPDAWGVALWKDNWAGAASVLLPTGLTFVFVSMCMCAALGLKARGQVQRILRATMVQAPLLVILGIVGAVLGGAEGAAWGFAMAQLAGVVMIWSLFLASDREAARGPMVHSSSAAAEETQGRLA